MTDTLPSSAPQTPPAETPDIITGNHHHKYESSNPAIRYLTRRFLRSLDGLLDRVMADTPRGRVLEVGCGEGLIATRLLQRWANVTALDLPDASLRAWWQEHPGPHYVHGDASRLPFPDDFFDVVVAVEVMEHLTEPEQGLAEMARVSSGHLMLSVPREPIFRTANMLGGRHLRDWGNTPGHLNHWSTPSFVKFVSQAAAVRAVEKPLPWTITWARRA
jgi:2-polyprenyl-3-methyl-5-hydroxy-6-metoxy-1,4-benzoquinol methylase